MALKTFTTVHWLTFCWFEWNFTFLLTFRTYCLVHFSRAVVKASLWSVSKSTRSSAAESASGSTAESTAARTTARSSAVSAAESASWSFALTVVIFESTHFILRIVYLPFRDSSKSLKLVKKTAQFFISALKNCFLLGITLTQNAYKNLSNA